MEQAVPAPRLMPLAQAPAAGGKGRKRKEDELSRRLAKAFGEGREKGRREAEEALAEERRQIEERHAAELAERERRWREETGRELGERIDEGLRRLEQALAEQLADILRPLMEEAARRMALERLGEEVRRMLAAEGGLKVRISGPVEMLEAMRERLGEDADGVVMEPDETQARLVAHVDDTVIETRIGEWAATLGPAQIVDDAP